MKIYTGFALDYRQGRVKNNLRNATNLIGGNMRSNGRVLHRYIYYYNCQYYTIIVIIYSALTNV